MFLENYRELDKILLLSIFILLALGIIFVSISSPFVAIRIGVNPLYFINNHIIYMSFSILVMLIMIFIPLSYILRLSIFISIIAIIMMVFISFNGVEIKGARRWFYIFGLSIQPSEFIKICFPIVFAIIYNGLILYEKSLRFIYFNLSLIYIFIIILLLLQPDIGMSILLSAVFVSMMMMIGLQLRWLYTIVIFLLTIMGFSYWIFPHVKYRVNSFLFDENSYQISKALNAIKSGGFFGASDSTTSLANYVPDSHTDFIFAIACERFGIIFGAIIILIYLVIAYRAYKFILKSNNFFKIISTVGIIITMLTQVFIHVASNLHLIPTKGMTLPLLSYGGSSLLSNCIMMGFLLVLTKKDINDIILKLK